MPPFKCICTLRPSDGVRFLVFAHNYRVFFSPEHPELVPLDRRQNAYTKNDDLQSTGSPASRAARAVALTTKGESR